MVQSNISEFISIFCPIWIPGPLNNHIYNREHCSVAILTNLTARVLSIRIGPTPQHTPHIATVEGVSYDLTVLQNITLPQPAASLH